MLWTVDKASSITCYFLPVYTPVLAFSALTLLAVQQEGHPAWWEAGKAVCLGQGADLHMAHLMPLPLTISSSQ